MGSSAAQLADVLDVDRPDVTEQQHQDRQSNRRLCRGDGQDEEHEHLSSRVAEEAGEGDEVEVDGEEHQLDRHQDDENVASVEKDTDDADRKQDGPENQVMRQRRLRQPCHVDSPQLPPGRDGGGPNSKSFTTEDTEHTEKISSKALDNR